MQAFLKDCTPQILPFSLASISLNSCGPARPRQLRLYPHDFQTIQKRIPAPPAPYCRRRNHLVTARLDPAVRSSAQQSTLARRYSGLRGLSARWLVDPFRTRRKTLSSALYTPPPPCVHSHRHQSHCCPPAATDESQRAWICSSASAPHSSRADSCCLVFRSLAAAVVHCTAPVNRQPHHTADCRRTRHCRYQHRSRCCRMPRVLHAFNRLSRLRRTITHTAETAIHSGHSPDAPPRFRDRLAEYILLDEQTAL